MGLRYGQGKYGEFRYGLSQSGFSFRIEIRDSSGNLKALLNREVKAAEWSYSDRGGCDRMKLFLRRDYDDLANLSASTMREQYDIQIYIASEYGGTASLYWRGYVENIRPMLREGEEVIIAAVGYVNRLRELQARSGADPMEYSDTTIEDIVDDLADTYAVTEANITKGTIDSFGVSVDSMRFSGSVFEALDKLADIVDAEWGVDRTKTLFFRARSTARGRRFRVGYDIELLEDEYAYSQIANRIIVEGGQVDGATFRRVFEYDEGTYFRKDKRVSNSAILSTTVAQAYANSVYGRLKDFSRNLRLTIPRNRELIESVVPMKRVVIDKDPRPELHKYGSFKYGEQKYSGDEDHRMKKISYQLTDTSLATDIEFNEGKPDITNTLERLEFELEQVRQSEE